MQLARPWIALAALTLALVLTPHPAAAEERKADDKKADDKPGAQAATGKILVTVSAYSPRGGGKTASGARPAAGMVALSPDIEKKLGVEFGDRVRLEGLGTYVFQDRMGGRRARVDIYMGSSAKARKFGLRRRIGITKG